MQADRTERPTADGGVWGSYVEYLDELERWHAVRTTIYDKGVADGQRAMADALWAKAKALRDGYRTGPHGIEYVNGFEDAAEAADPDAG